MTPLPPSYDALQREVDDLRKRVRAQAYTDKVVIEELTELRKRVQQLEAERGQRHPYAVLGDQRIGVSTTPLPNACSVCGMNFVSPQGIPIPMGYVCHNSKCPTGMRRGTAVHTYSALHRDTEQPGAALGVKAKGWEEYRAGEKSGVELD